MLPPGRRNWQKISSHSSSLSSWTVSAQNVVFQQARTNRQPAHFASRTGGFTAPPL